MFFAEQGEPRTVNNAAANSLSQKFGSDSGGVLDGC